MIHPFATFGIAPSFHLDLTALEKTHRELSRALHPDKFARASASERRASLEKAAQVNEAWRILRDPIRRAEALFRLAGCAVGETAEPKPSGAFLMDILEAREELAEARAKRDLPKVRALRAKMEERRDLAEGRLSRAFHERGAELGPDAKESLAPSLPLLGELRFYRRFLDEVSAIEEEEEGSS